MSDDLLTFADLKRGDQFIILTPGRDDVPLSTVYQKRDDEHAQADRSSGLGVVRVMPDVRVAKWPQ